ncbi:MAG: prepilin peptidase [Archangium sp.]|nr:prepilin peptidase [Archangium sp.]
MPGNIVTGNPVTGNTVSGVLLDVVLAAAVLASAWSDLSRERIIGWIPAGAIVGSLALRLVVDGVGDPWTGALSGLLGGATTGALFAGFALWGRRLGWDDVALLIAVGSNRGFPACLDASMRIALVGAAGAVVFALSRGRVSDTLRAVFRRSGDAVTMPYSLAVVLGSSWAWLSAA